MSANKPDRALGATANSRVRRATSFPDGEAVLNVAAELFARRGFANTTMQDLADALGIAKPTLYARTKSKAQILEGICERVLRAADARVEEARGLGRPPEQLEALISAWTEIAVSMPAHYRVFFADERELPPHLSRYFQRWSSETFGAIRAIVVEGQRSGDFDGGLDPTAVAFAIVGVTVWTARWFTPDGSLSVDGLAKTNCRLLLDGLLPQRVPRLSPLAHSSIALNSPGR